MHWLRLAHEWGCPVREAQQRASSYDFAEEMAYYNLEPYGNILSVLCGKRRPSPQQSQEEIRDNMLAFIKACGNG